MRVNIILVLAVLLSGCGGSGSGNNSNNDPDSEDDGQRGVEIHDPLAVARAAGLTLNNEEAPIPPQCYTRTEGASNPCWVCHTGQNNRNYAADKDLQREYAFSDYALLNHWHNFFADRSAAVATISDDAALTYIRQDNYTPLRAAMADAENYYGWRPDIDLQAGFDSEGFASDGSWWRAFRYKPFPGTFWPTNGSSDDVMIRLPPALYTGADGLPSAMVYKINLAILEAALAVPDTVMDIDVERTIEAVDEALAGIDLDGDGMVAGAVSRIRGLPAAYVAFAPGSGMALSVPVIRWQYPEGTEFLHTVRYLDPAQPTLLSTRLKEVRYSRKERTLDNERTQLVYAEEKLEKERGLSPFYAGTSLRGLHNELGWMLQGFIEDNSGRLRLQTHEEHYYCMGCHSNLGVTVDQTFAFPRKVPGAIGWGHQDLRGIADVPQAGHADPEILTYFRRVGGGDEFRSNQEVLDNFFPGGVLDEASVRRSAAEGDRDITALIMPTPERALALDKAYMALVQTGDFAKGRDTVLQPPSNVHPIIVNGDTGLEQGIGVFEDARLWLDWPAN